VILVEMTTTARPPARPPSDLPRRLERSSLVAVAMIPPAMRTRREMPFLLRT
jgi:hypothetical protein